MLAEPIMFACKLSSGSTWSMPSILPRFGDQWPTGVGASAYAVFSDLTGEVLATVTGTMSATAVDFQGVDHTIVDQIPAGANCEIFVTDSDGKPYKIRYGRVVRREVGYPGAPNPTAIQLVNQPLSFSDPLQRDTVGNNWIALAGHTQMYLDHGRNDQQIISLGSVLGGEFMLVLNNVVATLPISWQASADQIVAMLEPIVGMGNVTVTGLNPWTITFINELGNLAQDTLGLISYTLTGADPIVDHPIVGQSTLYGLGAVNDNTGPSNAAVRYAYPLNTENVTINAGLLNKGPGKTGLILGADINMSSGLVVQFDSINNVIQPGIMAGNNLTITAEGSPVSKTLGGTIPDNYTITYNNTTKILAVYEGTSTEPIITWPDNGSVVPHGPGLRYLGANWLNPQSSDGVQITSWAAQDTL